MNDLPSADLIRPLTRRRKSGRVLTREPDVEAQIREALHLSPEQLFLRLQVRDYRAAGYLRDECIVYLIRDYFRSGENGVVTKLWGTLLARYVGRINRRLRGLRDDSDRWDHAREDVIAELMTRIFDVETDRADYFQVRFERAVRMLTIRVFDRYRREKERADRAVRLSYVNDVHDEDNEGATRGEEPEDTALPPNLEFLCREALEAIQDERCREAFILRYYAGWPERSEDPSVPTISEEFGVTDRTVRNWLNRAKADLRRWRGEEGD